MALCGLRSSANRHTRGSSGWRGYIDYIRQAAMSDDEDALAYMKAFDLMTKKKQAEVLPEEVCDLSGVQPSDFIALVAKQVWLVHNGQSQIIAAVQHPRVLEATAKSAINVKNGGRDRELFFRINGNLPDKKGNSIIFAPQTLVMNGEAGPRTVPPGYLPSMEEDVVSMDRLLDSSRTVIDLKPQPVEEKV